MSFCDVSDLPVQALAINTAQLGGGLGSGCLQMGQGIGLRNERKEEMRAMPAAQFKQIVVSALQPDFS